MRQRFVENLARRNREFYASDEGRGTLRALDLAFDHTWVYVFELIQNALDACADKLSFHIEADDSLVFQHNGSKPLREVDVEGLAKVFRSTKGVASVGFMGIGFKSVLARYPKVTVSGWGWKFGFDVPETVGERYRDVQRNMLGAVIPMWDDSISNPEEGYTTRFQMHGTSASTIRSDLAHLTDGPDKPFLAMLAQANVQSLHLDGTSWELGVHQVDSGVVKATGISDDDNRLWQVFTVDWEPTDDAVGRLLEYRKITPVAKDQDQIYREASRERQVVGVMPLDDEGIPTPPTTGHVHALLPTDLNLPLGLHVSADWLLNISRTGLRDIEDNAWQRGIVDAIADLFGAYVRWIPSMKYPEAVHRAYSALQSNESGNVLEALLEDDWGARLRGKLRDLPIIPAWDVDDKLEFRQASDVLVPPQPLARAFAKSPSLMPSVLLGGPVLATDILGPGPRHLLSGDGTLRDMRVDELQAMWHSGLEAWWTVLDGDEEAKRQFLFEVWAAVSELGDGTESLRCVRTEQGEWVEVSSVSYINEALPSDDVPGGREVREFLVSGLPDSERILPASWVQALRRVQGHVATAALKWVSTKATALSLKTLVAGAMAKLSSARVPDWSILVPFGLWAHRLGRSDLLTHVLVTDGTTQTGVPAANALLAEPYVEDGATRRRLSKRTRVVSPSYVSDTDVNADQWAAFFVKAGVTGELKVTRYTDTSYRHSDAEEFAGRKLADRSTRGGYGLVDFDITWNDGQSVLSSLSIPRDAQDLARWLERWFIRLRGCGHRRVDYFYYTRQTTWGKKPSRWASKLSEISWVPCQDLKIRRPAQVLPRVDHVRDESPVAALRPELVNLLESEGVKFGTEIPSAPSLRRLLKVGDDLESIELAKLLDEVRKDVETEEDREHFRDAVMRLRIPVETGRVSMDRFVRRSDGNRRGRLGGWIVPLSDVEDALRNAMTRSGFPYDFPEQTTGTQALAFLENVWRNAKSSPSGLLERDRNALPTAYAYIREDVLVDDVLQDSWVDALANAMVFSSGQWLPLSGDVAVYFDDLLDRRFIPSGVHFSIATSGHFGANRAAQEATAEALGLRKLSSVCRLDWSTINGPSRVVLDRDQSVSRVWRLLATVPNADRTETMPPRVQSVESLRLTVRMQGHDEGEQVDIHARLHADTLTLAGRPIQFAADAAKELLASFGFGQRGGLASDLTAMLSAIDQPDDLRLAARKFRRAHLPAGASGDDWLDDGQARREVPGRVVGEAGTYRSSVGVAASTRVGEQQAGSDSPPQVDDHSADPDRLGALHRASSGGAESSDREPAVLADHGAAGEAQIKEAEGPAAPVDTGSGSYVADRAFAHQRRLVNELERSLKGKVVPAEGVPRAREPTGGVSDPVSGLGDEAFRAAVLRYEHEAGREPTEGGPRQVGWDIRSVDRNTGVVRLIEVKGRRHPWTGDEVVELSRAQVRAAFAEEDAQWWLYVVELTDSGQYRVLPIPNPAQRSTKWLLEGGPWRHLAQDPRTLAE